MILLLEKILPLLGVVVVIVLIAIVQKIAHPSKLVWGRILSDLGPVRAHLVLDYNEQIDDEQPMRGRLGREARRQQFRVNWGYLRAGVKNTVCFTVLSFLKKTR